ncbi:GNAT family N-acetyltransferase [Streptomyces sp. NPDC048270]|uniref:GNAT family N-acetyltransferase n=1 Tax=Streptomyces sp. NPDC048270 TaxID=3154615 RepID=UPI0033E056DF
MSSSLPTLGSVPDTAPFTIRVAGHADTTAYMNLIAHADPHDPDPFGLARDILARHPGRPLSHHRDLCLLAEDSTGTAVGALLGGVPRWVLEHPGIDTLALTDRMISHLGMIHAVAVHPDQRRRGIGRALIQRAEERFTQAGYGVMTLNHAPELDGYYRSLGYTVDDALLVHLPPQRLIGMTADDTRMSAKPLRPSVRLAEVPGAPHRVITSLLPGASLPPSATFDGTRLQY